MIVDAAEPVSWDGDGLRGKGLDDWPEVKSCELAVEISGEGSTGSSEGGLLFVLVVVRSRRRSRKSLRAPPSLWGLRGACSPSTTVAEPALSDVRLAMPLSVESMLIRLLLVVGDLWGVASWTENLSNAPGQLRSR